MSEAPSPVGELTRRTARSAALRGSAEVVGKIATLAWTVVAARFLTTEQFGEVTYAMALMLLLSTVGSWGLDAGITRRGAAEPDRLPQIYAASQLWRTLGLLLVFGVAAALMRDSPEVGSAAVLLGMLAAGFPGNWSLSARSAAAARHAAAEVSAALVVQRVFTAVAVIAAVAAGLGPVGLTVAFALGTLVGWQGHRLALRRLAVRFPWHRLRRIDLSDALRGTFLIGLSGIVSMALLRLDVVMIGAFLGATQVAIYSVAYRLLETVIFVNYAINQAVLPVLSATSSRARRQRGWERAVAVAAFAFVPFLAVCVVESRRVIDLVFGAQYAVEAAPVLAWLAPAPLLLAMGFFGSSVLLALERSRPILLATVAALVVNVGLNLVLIPAPGAFGGVVGAAIATTVAYAVQAVITLVALMMAGHRVRVLRPLVTSTLAVVPVVAILLLWGGLPLLVELAAAAVVYLVVWALVARRIAPEQWQVLSGLVGGVLRSRRRRAGDEAAVDHEAGR